MKFIIKIDQSYYNGYNIIESIPNRFSWFYISNYNIASEVSLIQARKLIKKHYEDYHILHCRHKIIFLK